MEVVGYLNHADLLLKDAEHVAVIGGGHYVLSLGDRVYLKHGAHCGECEVELSFLSQTDDQRCIDQMTLKFKGNEQDLKRYLNTTTVH